MSLAIDSTIGNYRIVHRIGGGAMGEVYRARDERIGRDVAIKIIDAEERDTESRRHRFEKEVRAVSALNHPNILTLYDVGHDDDKYYIVTELIEGESLRAAMQGGPVPMRRLLEREVISSS
jgi:serine/threonine protein kinase